MMDAGVLEQPHVDEMIIFHFVTDHRPGIDIQERVASATLGKVEIEVRGLSTHWAAYETGIDAIHAAALAVECVTDINRYYPLARPFALGIGTIQGGTGRKQKRIGQKVGNLVVIMQMISVVFAVGICVIMFRSLTTSMLRDRCINGTNMLSYILSQTDGSEDMNQILDDLKSRMGCEFTIFEGDTRAYTTVIQNGNRAVGTKLSSSLSSTILQQGKSFVGKAKILNEEYLASYVPTTDANGKVNGLIFAGISSAEVTRQIGMTVIVSSVVSLAIIAVCVLIMAAFLKKSVSYPLAEITHVAERLERGDLDWREGMNPNRVPFAV